MIRDPETKDPIIKRREGTQPATRVKARNGYNKQHFMLYIFCENTVKLRWDCLDKAENLVFVRQACWSGRLMCCFSPAE